MFNPIFQHKFDPDFHGGCGWDGGIRGLVLLLRNSGFGSEALQK